MELFVLILLFIDDLCNGQGIERKQTWKPLRVSFPSIHEDSPYSWCNRNCYPLHSFVGNAKKTNDDFKFIPEEIPEVAISNNQITPSQTPATVFSNDDTNFNWLKLAKLDLTAPPGSCKSMDLAVVLSLQAYFKIHHNKTITLSPSDIHYCLDSRLEFSEVHYQLYMTRLRAAGVASRECEHISQIKTLNSEACTSRPTCPFAFAHPRKFFVGKATTSEVVSRLKKYGPLVIHFVFEESFVGLIMNLLRKLLPEVQFEMNKDAVLKYLQSQVDIIQSGLLVSYNFDQKTNESFYQVYCGHMKLLPPQLQYILLSARNHTEYIYSIEEAYLDFKIRAKIPFNFVSTRNK